MSPYFQDDSLTLYAGGARDVLKGLPDQSVNCVVTSPPYFGLRDYGHPDQIGLEDTPDEYVGRLCAVFAEVWRVLADDGTVWLNLGDSYYSGKGAARGQDVKQCARRFGVRPLDKSGMGVPPKSLLMIPARVALRLQSAGWIVRSEVIWSKRNFMPEGSAHDRPTRSHEQLYLLAKRGRYWFDSDAIREESDPAQEAHNRRYAREYAVHTGRAADTGQPGNVNNVGIHSRPGKGGRNARSVWTISSTPYRGAHFAVMPLELASKCVRSACKPGGVLLDPFCGSGTSLLAAQQSGRRAVGVDLNPDYLELALRRCQDTPLPMNEGGDAA